MTIYELKIGPTLSWLRKNYPLATNIGAGTDDEDNPMATFLRINHLDQEVFAILSHIPNNEVYWKVGSLYKKQSNGDAGQTSSVSADFQPEQVECKNHGSPALRTQLETMLNNPDGDIYFLSHTKEVLAVAKELASQGDAKGMATFGSMKRERLIFDNIFDEHGRYISGVMPAGTKEEMTEALTYIYLSAAARTPYEPQASELVHTVEANRSDLKTPPEWIQDAKTNAEHWKASCERSQ